MYEPRAGAMCISSDLVVEFSKALQTIAMEDIRDSVLGGTIMVGWLLRDLTERHSCRRRRAPFLNRIIEDGLCMWLEPSGLNFPAWHDSWIREFDEHPGE